MKSIKELLITGPGPSSSHTIAPNRICLDFLNKIKDKEVERIDVTLFGSLALTGRGHFTDKIIKEVFKNYECNIYFDTNRKDIPHPNTMEIKATIKDGFLVSDTYISIGGGAFMKVGEQPNSKDIYPFTNFDGLKEYAFKTGLDIFEIITKIEGEDILEYGKRLLIQSFETLEKSLKWEGILPGPLKLKACAKNIYDKANTIDDSGKLPILLTAFAYAIGEANARGETIVTTPTCGAAGVVPAVLYYEYKINSKSIDELAKAYLVGALVCNFIKENASISGALLGCQAEIGSASSFAAASLCYLHNLSIHQIEYGAEVAMEHFLGLTCDPVDGFVQIPCIERNGIAAIHSYSAYLYANNIEPLRKNKVTFDNVVKAMNITGKELPSELKETSLGGLAKVIS